MPLRVLAFGTIVILALVLFVLVGYGVTGATRDLPATCLEDADCIALADLEAQRSMAWAAWWMFGAALMSIVLTIVGAVLLLQNLAEARRTNTNALRSAVAAETAVEISSRTAQNQLRAYIHVTSVTIKGVGALGDPESANRPRIKFVMHNSGQTPARQVLTRMYVIVAVLGGSLKSFDDIVFEKKDDNRNSGDLGPGGDRTVNFDFDEPLIDRLRLRFNDYGKTTRYYLFGDVTYHDVFGNEHCLDFRFTQDRLEDGALLICDVGNQETSSLATPATAH